MCGGGGGGGGGGNDWTYFANIQHDRDEAARLAAERADREAKEEKARLHREFLSNLAEAETGAWGTGMKYLADRGYTRNDDLVSRIISEAKARVPTDDSSPAKYLSSDIFETGIKKEEERVRGSNTGRVNSFFTPGFERNYISDTTDDPILDAILGEQSKTAMTQLQYNKDRGLLNDVGYGEALSRFKNQEGAARSTLTGIGDAVLGKVRGGIKDIAGEAGTAASNWSYGNPNFDLTPYISRANDFAASERGNLEGKIRSSLGDTQLFDIPSILGAAGTAQGPINLTTQGKDVMTPFDSKKNRNQRGLSSTGAF